MTGKKLKMNRKKFNKEYNSEDKKEERIAYLSFLAESNPKINNMTYVSFGQAANMVNEIYEDFETKQAGLKRRLNKALDYINILQCCNNKNEKMKEKLEND